MSAPPAPARAPGTRSRTAVTSLCWAAVLLDGFDLVVLGATIPSLAADPEWRMSAGTASAIATAGLVGMTVGALGIGTLTDRIGRRRALIASVVVFSLLTAAIAAVQDPVTFGVLRFLAGVGLGGCLPTAITLVNEFSPGARGGRATTRVMTGYHVGAVATALLALVLLEPFGWRAMFVAGALPALVLVPVMLRSLPESPSFLLATGRTEEARELSAAYGLELPDAAPAGAPRGAGAGPTAVGSHPVRTLFSAGFLRTSLAIWFASFFGLLLVYGLNTWLPQIMRQAGYDLGQALVFLLLLNAGAVAGLLVAGPVADRIGPRRAGLVWFVAAAVLLALLAAPMPGGLVFVAVFLAGCFVFSAQVLVYAFTSAHHPAAVRATALGWSAGVGRLGAISGPIIGGALVGAQLAVPWGFYLFAVFGGLGALGVALTARTRATAAPAA